MSKSTVQSACARCPAGHDCALLAEALDLGESLVGITGDAFAVDELASLKRSAESYGFSYPRAVSLCWLHDKATLIHELTGEGMGLIERMRTEDYE